MLLSLPLLDRKHNCNPVNEWKLIPVVHQRRAERDHINREELDHAEKDDILRTQSSSYSFLSLFYDWFFDDEEDNKIVTFQIPLSGDERKRGINGYVARMQSSLSLSSYYSNPNDVQDKRNNKNKNDNFINIVRENLHENTIPTSAEIEIDNRFNPMKRKKNKPSLLSSIFGIEL